MKNFKKLLTVSLLLVGAIHTAHATSLEQTDWELIQLNPSQAQSLPQLRLPLTLGFNHGMVYGFNGCNSFHSGYQHNEQRSTLTINTQRMATTRMACLPKAENLSQDFQQVLQRTTHYQMTAKELTLLDKKGRMLARFSKPLTELPNTQWKVASYNSGNALVTSVNSARMTAAFDKQGQLSGFAGCNHYRASYKIDPSQGTLQVDKMGSTRKMCHTPDRVMKEEQAFLAAWQRVRSYQRLGKKLTLFDYKGTRVFTFRLLADTAN
ncbi:META domain-containing protein [Thiofilum flexile]|uniref:META domain-containing protein n=1 Tax=Thiofilum flexile TaxID=125627 RepID=UPI0003797300|nr:META domain-containing protein [Thiofilum flexile]